MTTENPNEAEPRVHVVQPGENLSAIAQKYYGAENAAHWITIYNFNREVVGDNPDYIQAGISLVIPDLTDFLTD